VSQKGQFRFNFSYVKTTPLFTGVKIQAEICVVTTCSVVVGCQLFRGPCPFHLQGEVCGEDGSSMDLQNVGILTKHYTASQPIRRPELNQFLFATINCVRWWINRVEHILPCNWKTVLK
jgi:hypothetical protein